MNWLDAHPWYVAIPTIAIFAAIGLSSRANRASMVWMACLIAGIVMVLGTLLFALGEIFAIGPPKSGFDALSQWIGLGFFWALYLLWFARARSKRAIAIAAEKRAVQAATRSAQARANDMAAGR